MKKMQGKTLISDYEYNTKSGSVTNTRISLIEIGNLQSDKNQ
jgi:hypothetical protein